MQYLKENVDLYREQPITINNKITVFKSLNFKYNGSSNDLKYQPH